MISTDPAHSLADVLQAEVGGEPTKVAKRLHAQQVQAQDELEHHWSAVSEWLGSLLMERGVDRIAAEELTVPPGGDELFSLLVLKNHAESEDWDVIVVDCAPTGETLRLLSFPDAARWWLDKVLGREQSMLSAARPLARMFLDVQLPDEKVVAEVQRLVGQPGGDARAAARRFAGIDAARDDTGPDGRHRGDADVHLPEPLRLSDRRRRRRTACSRTSWPRATSAPGTPSSRSSSALVGSAFAPVPVLRAPYFDAEVIGDERLDQLAEALFASHDAAGVLHDRLAQELRVDNGRAELRLDLPFVSKGDVKLKKIGLELVVRVDGHKRTIVLPGAMAGYKPTSATLEDGALTVGFEHG